MNSKSYIKIGIVIVVAIALIIVGINYLKGVNIFNNNTKLLGKYYDIQQLVPGSRVRLKGVQIGVVSDVRFSENQDFVIVEINISNSKLKIPNDSKAKLESDFFGVSFIDLSLGKNYSNILKNNDSILTDSKVSLSSIISNKIDPLEFKVNSLLTNIDSTIITLNNLLGKNGNKFGSIISNTDEALVNVRNLTKNTNDMLSKESDKISKILDNFSQILLTINSQSGNISKTSENIRNLTDNLSQVDINSTIKELNQGISSLKSILLEIEKGSGTLHNLVYTNELDSKLNTLLKSTDNLINDLKDNPKKYVHFSLFGKKDNNLNLDNDDKKKLKEILENK